MNPLLQQGGIVLIMGDDISDYVAKFAKEQTNKPLFWLAFHKDAIPSSAEHPLQIRSSLSLISDILTQLQDNVSIVIDAIPYFYADDEKHAIHVARLTRHLLNYTYRTSNPVFILTRPYWFEGAIYASGGRILERAATYIFLIEDGNRISLKYT